MAYRIHDLERVPDEVRRVARERLTHAAAALVDGDGRAEAVHTARKDLKKTRSLLRLVRPGLPGKAFRAHNGGLRAIARSLESAREAEALASTAEALADHANGRLIPEAFADLAVALRGSAPDVNATARAVRGCEAAVRLQAAADAVAEWPLDGVDAGTLLDGVVRGYARGRDELAAVRRSPTSDELHEWRKRVKDLWYHTRLLRPAAPTVLGAMVEDADRLADALGDEHDLAELARRLDVGEPSVAGVVVGEATLCALLHERRTALRVEAAQVAARLYAERPKALRRRMAAILLPAPVALPIPD